MKTIDGEPDLNRKVAVEFMDWRVAPRNSMFWIWGAPDEFTAFERGNFKDITVFKPSVNIDDAMLVVAKHDKFFCLKWSSDYRRQLTSEKKWSCRFAAPAAFEVWADTAPMAICFAALKWVERTKEKR